MRRAICSSMMALSLMGMDPAGLSSGSSGHWSVSHREFPSSGVLGLAIYRSFLSLMMIAFITIKSSLVPLIEGLCAQIYFRFEISVVCSHDLLFFFVKGKTC